MPLPSDRAVNDGETAAVAVHAPSFRQTVAAGLGMVKAVPVAAILLFLVLAPQLFGFYGEVFAFRTSGVQLPPWLIVAMLIGHASVLWLPLLSLIFPWIAGGAAALRGEESVPPRHRTFIEQANRFYGRSLALSLAAEAALFVLWVLLYALPLGLAINATLATVSPGPWIVRMPLHPPIVAFSIGFWLVAAFVIVGWAMTIAIMTAEDIGLRHSLWRGIEFLWSHPAATSRFWIVVVVIGLPGIALLYAAFFVPVTPVFLVVLATVATCHAASSIALILATADSLLAPRRTVTEFQQERVALDDASEASPD